uniref:RING-type domain-containing protein n=1 Tax=viral metagenome TaxID=1070528 RepID=A0A6C0HVC0_9ZZZZ
MAGLINPNLIEIRNQHRDDIILLNFLQRVEEMQNVFNNADALEQQRIYRGYLAQTQNELIGIRKNNHLNVNNSIYNTLNHMLIKGYAIERARIIFSEIIENNRRVLIRHVPDIIIISGIQRVTEMVNRILQILDMPGQRERLPPQALAQNAMLAAANREHDALRNAALVAARPAAEAREAAIEAARIAEERNEIIADLLENPRVIAALLAEAQGLERPAPARGDEIDELMAALREDPRLIAALRNEEHQGAAAAAQRALRGPTLQQNIHELDQERQAKIGVSYSERLNCVLCLNNEVNTVLIPCGHLFCSRCIQTYKEREIAKRVTPKCPQCRTEFKGMHNIYYQKYLKYKNKYLALKRDI